MELLTKYKWPLEDIIAGKWDQKYLIKKNLPFYFKVYDNNKLVSYIQHQIKVDEDFKSSFLVHQTKLEELKSIKVWLNHDAGLIQMTIYDIYQSFLTHLKNNAFEDQLFNSHKLSLLGPIGPFTEMPLINCLNEDLINKFIFSNIVKNKLPTRKLRVYTEGDVKVNYGKDFSKFSFLKIRQITDSGILFSSTEDELINSMEDGEFIKVHLGTEYLERFIDGESFNDKEFQQDIYKSKQEDDYFFIKEEKVIKSLSYQSGVTNEIFFFCRYQYFDDSHLAEICSLFMQKVQGHLLQSIGA